MWGDALVGRVLSGRYEIVRVIGQGGGGLVVKALDTRLRRDVALKFLPQQGSGGNADRRLFEREARALASLRHRHIVDIFDFEFGENPYLVMEYIEGATLQDLIVSATLTPDRHLRYMGQIAEALSYVHSRGIVHRDIKPSNIIIESAEEAYLIDFGIALAEGRTRVTKTGVLKGTAGYLAPELLLGKPATIASDIYALGITLRSYFAQNPSRDGASVPSGPLRALIASMTHEDPGERERDAGEVAEQLRREAQGQPSRTKKYNDLAESPTVKIPETVLGTVAMAPSEADLERLYRSSLDLLPDGLVQRSLAALRLGISGDHAGMSRQLEDLLPSIVAILGPVHLVTRKERESYAIALRNCGKSEEGLTQLRALVDDCASKLGPFHYATLGYERKLGKVVGELNIPEGLRILRKVKSAMLARYGAEWHESERCISDLTGLEEDQANMEELLSNARHMMKNALRDSDSERLRIAREAIDLCAKLGVE